MSRDGRRDFGLIILTCVVVCLLVATIAIALATRSDLSTDNRQIAQLQKGTAATRQEIATLRASVNGSHRDLITCGDLQSVESDIDGIVASQGAIGPVEFVTSAGGVISSLPLPGHCINR